MALQGQWTYAFLDVNASIQDPGGAFSLSQGGLANEGITITPDERMTIQRGAAGDWMYTLHAAQGGTFEISVLKNGILNAQLARLVNFDFASSANVGQGVITVSNPVVGDSWTLIGCAFKRLPKVAYSADGAINVWEGIAGIISGVLGNGSPSGVTPTH